MEKTNYIVVFIFILTATVALGLTGLRELTKEAALRNEQIFNKRAILKAVENHLPDGKSVNDLSDDEVLTIFNEKVEQVTINAQGEEVQDVLAEKVELAQEDKKAESERLLPLFIYAGESDKYYITSVRGKGLWDAIWGNIAFEDDLNTITGVAFDHAAETPGLGAEIKDNPAFGKQFEGKKIYDGDQYVSVDVVKGGAKDPMHEVDGISGATITSVGVAEMLESDLKKYKPYFEKLMKKTSMLMGKSQKNNNHQKR